MATLNNQKSNCEWVLHVIANGLDTDSFLLVARSLNLFVKIATIFEAGYPTKWNVNYWKDARVKAFLLVFNADVVAKKLESFLINNVVSASQKSEIKSLKSSLSNDSLTRNNCNNAKISVGEKNHQTSMTSFLKSSTSQNTVSIEVGRNYNKESYVIPSLNQDEILKNDLISVEFQNELNSENIRKMMEEILDSSDEDINNSSHNSHPILKNKTSPESKINSDTINAGCLRRLPFIMSFLLKRLSTIK